jgi:fructokinase
VLSTADDVRPAVEALVAQADVVKLSDEDLEFLQPGTGVASAASSLLGGRTRLVVVTSGGTGAYAVSAAGAVEVHSRSVAVVDTVGAGDSFTAGMLDGLQRGDLIGAARRDALAAIDRATLESVVGEAAHIAAITCSRTGADPPTRSELDAGLAGEPSA